MARQARKASSTDYYHLMVRGINKEKVFTTKQHKRVLLKYINQQLDPNGIYLLAWCIMNNHAHLVVQAELKDISKFIKIVLIKFSYYYNKFNNRVGPVFGDRFRSEAIEDDNSLKQVVRYVHRNPVKACIVDNIEEYEFSSYLEFINDEQYIDSSQKDFYMDYFKSNKSRYINFHKEEQIVDFFIDIKEQNIHNQEEKFWSIVQDFNEKYNIQDLKEYKVRKQQYYELIHNLYENTDFSISKIADLLDTSSAKVRYALKKYE